MELRSAVVVSATISAEPWRVSTVSGGGVPPVGGAVATVLPGPRERADRQAAAKAQVATVTRSAVNRRGAKRLTSSPR
jgi:hypothetical protein